MSQRTPKENDSARLPRGPEFLTVLTSREKTELRGQEFRSQVFDGFDLSEADLSFAIFIECSLVRCSFRKADLRHARFDRCDLRWSVFEGAQLGENRFDGSSLGGVSGLQRHDVGYARRRGGSFTLDVPTKAAEDDA